MSLKKILNSVFVLVLIAALFSCSSEEKIVRKKRIIPAERLTVKVEANRRKIKTFRGSGVITVNSKQINSKFNFSVEYIKPDSLKITAFGPFGIDIAQLLLTDEFFNYYDAVANVLYQGKNEEQIIERIFRVPLTQNELKNLMLGKADFSKVLRKNPAEYEFSSGVYSMKFTDETSGVTRFYRIDGKDLALLDFELTNSKNEKLLSASFSKFRKVKNLNEKFPFRIYVESKKNDAVFEIEYHSVKINEKLSDLRLLLPADVTIKKY